MIERNHAIVLALHKKGDNSCLLEAYTAEGGRALFMVFGKRWTSMLQPMSIVDISFHHQPTRDVYNVVSVESTFVPKTNDVAHFCIKMFMAELMLKTLTHPMSDSALFDYIEKAVIQLDQLNDLKGFVEDFMKQVSQLAGYGGAILDEWRNLKSIDIIQTIQ